jgi:hypothetical protein
MNILGTFALAKCLVDWQQLIRPVAFIIETRQSVVSVLLDEEDDCRFIFVSNAELLAVFI